MYIPSSLDGPLGNPMGFQRWVNAVNMPGIASNKMKIVLLAILWLIHT